MFNQTKYAKDLFESKYQFLNNGREKIGIENSKNPKHSLIIHKQFMMFMKTQKTIIQQRKRKC